MSVRSGCLVNLLKEVHENWIQIGLNDKQGLVPRNYIIQLRDIYKCQALNTFKAKSSRQLSISRVNYMLRTKICVLLTSSHRLPINSH